MVSYAGTDSVKLTFQGQESKERSIITGGTLPSSDNPAQTHTQNFTQGSPTSQVTSRKKKKKGKEQSLTDVKASKDNPTTLKQDIINW